jgi:hypothetical protein
MWLHVVVAVVVAAAGGRMTATPNRVRYHHGVSVLLLDDGGVLLLLLLLSVVHDAPTKHTLWSKRAFSRQRRDGGKRAGKRLFLRLCGFFFTKQLTAEEQSPRLVAPVRRQSTAEEERCARCERFS